MNTTKATRYFLTQLLVLFALGPICGQSVLNGSLNGANSGNSQFGNMPDWLQCTDNLGANNSVDVCDINFPSYNNQTTVTPISSPDGGQWAGLANGMNPLEDECIIGNLTGLTIGENYLLEFYGACFGTGNGNYANGSPVSLTINIGNDVHIVVVPMAASIWNSYCLSYTALTPNMTFRIHNNAGDGYVGLDGFSTSTMAIQTTLTDTTFCEDDELLLDATTANSTYLWQDNSTDPTFNVTSAGTYWVQVNSGGCNVKVDTFYVQMTPLPVVDLGDTLVNCNGANLVLDATTANATYLWQDNSTDATYAVTTPNTYWVNVTVDGCSSIDIVRVEFEPCGAVINMPNVFTPNNDGSNDRFVPLIMEGILSAKLSIFNRWGQMLYETSNLSRGWNGSSDNGESPEGTYWWVIEYKGIDGRSEGIAGSLSLLR